MDEEAGDRAEKYAEFNRRRAELLAQYLAQQPVDLRAPAEVADHPLRNDLQKRVRPSGSFGTTFWAALDALIAYLRSFMF